MPHPPRLNLPEETIDDLLYFSRTSSLTDLRTTLSTLISPSSHSSPSISIPAILSAAVDPESGNTCLHYAAANGHGDVVAWIIGCLSSSVDEQEDTREPNHNDSSNGDAGVPEMHGSSEKGKSRADMHTPGSDILNAQNAAGNTPLHWASLNGQMEVVRMLVDAGADVRVRNVGGRDALEEAVGAERWKVVGWLSSKMGESEEGGSGEGGEGDDEKDVRADRREEVVDGGLNGKEENDGDGSANEKAGVRVGESGQREGVRDVDGVTESTKGLRLNDGEAG